MPDERKLEESRQARLSVSYITYLFLENTFYDSFDNSNIYNSNVR